MTTPKSMPVGVRGKLDRAQKHLQSVEEMLGGFTEGEAYSIDREVEEHGSRHVYRYRDLGWEMPGDLPVVVGDCLQNARSALDHLIYALSMGGRDEASLSKTQLRKMAFVITERPDDFKDARRGAALVPDAVWATMKRLQPHHSLDHPLRRLDKLSRIDRHRRLSVVAVAISRVPVPEWMEMQKTSGEIKWNTDPLEDGAVVLALSNPSDPEVDFRDQLEVAIGTHDMPLPLPAPLAPSLDGIIRYVEELVVPAFL